MPIKAISTYTALVSAGNFVNKNEAIRNDFAQQRFKIIVNLKDFRYEENSYYIRDSSSDPDNFLFYSGCKVNYGKSNTSDNRFTAAYLGTWNGNSAEHIKDNYFGDSSVFEFGTCQKTYD